MSKSQYPMIMNTSDDGDHWSEPIDVNCPTCKGGTFRTAFPQRGGGFVDIVPGDSRGLCVLNKSLPLGYRLISPTWSGSQYSDDGAEAPHPPGPATAGGGGSSSCPPLLYFAWLSQLCRPPRRWTFVEPAATGCRRELDHHVVEQVPGCARPSSCCFTRGATLFCFYRDLSLQVLNLMFCCRFLRDDDARRQGCMPRGDRCVLNLPATNGCD